MALDVFEEFAALTAALEAAAASYAVIGACALAIHGTPRSTSDIDLLVDEADLEQVKSIARTCGFDVEALPIRFDDGSVLHRVSKFEDEDYLVLDLLLVDDATRDAWESRLTIQSERGAIQVITRDALIAMKIAAGRDQDLADVARLKNDDR